MALLTPGTLFGADYAYLPANAAHTPTVAGIFIPIASIQDLTQAKADPSTGNSAEIIRGILEQSASVIQGLDAANRPARWALTKPNPSIITVNGSPAQRQSYTSAHDLAVVDVEPVSE